MPSFDPHAIRSLLFVPVLQQRFFAKAGERGAQALILDLEDSIAPERKSEARGALPGAVAALRATALPVLCRVNHSPLLEADLAACVDAGADAIMVPKVDAAVQVREIVECLASQERRHPRAEPVALVPLLETPQGVLRAADIAAADARVRALGFGAEDFALAMGVAPSGPLLEHAAAHAALAAHAAGIACWGLASSIAQLEDAEPLRQAARAARALGFTGSPAVHPLQVGIFNEAFGPSDADLSQARRVIAAYEAALRDGAGACRLDGRMIDRPIVERARRTLAAAGQE